MGILDGKLGGKVTYIICMFKQLLVFLLVLGKMELNKTLF